MGKLSTNLVIMRLGRGAGIGFSILFLLALVCPCCGEETQAMELPAPTENKLSVALSSQVDLNLTPEPAGSVQTGEISLRVSSGFKDGYTVYLGSSETSLTRTDKKAEIKATSSPATADRLPMNTWGYSFGRADANPNPTFSGLAGGETKLVETEVASSDDYTFDLATRVDTSLPAGTYSQDLTVSVVVNPLKPTTLTDITYMQDMTSEVCQNTPLMTSNPNVLSTSDPAFNDYSQPVSKALIDNRDKKSYSVARLADGKCWMSGNLAYAPMAIVGNAVGNPHYYVYENAKNACPENWQLPYYANQYTNDYRILFSAYNIQSSYTRKGCGTKFNKKYCIKNPPLNFDNNGYTSESSSITDFGHKGYYFASKGGHMCLQDIDGSDMFIFSTSASSWQAFSVRCVAK